MPVKELESYLGMKLLKPEEEEDIDTLGGLVFALVGRVPARGELVRHPSGLEFEILDADPRRVKKLRVHPPRAAANEAGRPSRLDGCGLGAEFAPFRDPGDPCAPNDFIRALAARVQALGGWRRRGAAFAAGSLSVLAMAPFFAWPVLWITLPVLVWLIDGAVADGGTGWRPFGCRAAEVGWWFGFGYFLFGLFWIGEAFLVEAEVFAVLLPVRRDAAAGRPGAVLRGSHGDLPHASGSLAWSRVLALALALSATEWLRGHVLTGFPWNVLGYALTYPLPLMQSAAVLGIYGLTLCAVLIFALPPVLWSEAADGSAGRTARRSALADCRAASAAGGPCRPGAAGDGHGGHGARRQDQDRAAERPAAGEVAPGEPGSASSRITSTCRRPIRMARPALAASRTWCGRKPPCRSCRSIMQVARAAIGQMLSGRHVPDHGRIAGRAVAARLAEAAPAFSTACWCSARAGR